MATLQFCIAFVWTMLMTCVHISFAVNDPMLSNYFIGEFDTLTQVLSVPYPPGICVREGLLVASYVEFECSGDYESITKKTYTPSNDDCSGSPTNTETYTLEAGIPQGDLHDFNCAGKENAMAYVTYLGSCSNSVGIAWLATDICYKYLNLSNITGNLGNYPDAPSHEYYQLSQRNTCQGCDLTMETYVGEQCQNADVPLSRFKADPGCEFYFNKGGFKVYADAVACIHDGEDAFTINGTCDYQPAIETTSEEGDIAIKIKYMVGVVVSLIILLHTNC